jgi:hypothetical protein
MGITSLFGAPCGGRRHCWDRSSWPGQGWGAGAVTPAPHAGGYPPVCWARRGCTSATPSGTVAPSFQGVPRLYSTRAPP